MIFNYDYIANILFNNRAGPDKTNKFYHDSDPDSASATIIVYNILGIPLTSFTRSDATTRYCKWNGGDDSGGNGTFANPYKSILKCWNTLDATHYQIGILTDNNDEDDYFEIGTRFLNNSVIGNATVRFFSLGNRTPTILASGLSTDPEAFFTASSGTGSATSIEFYNIWFNSYWSFEPKSSFITSENIKQKGAMMMQGLGTGKTYKFYQCAIINSGTFNKGPIFRTDYSIGRIGKSGNPILTNNMEFYNCFIQGRNDISANYMNNFEPIKIENCIISTINKFDFKNILSEIKQNIFYNSLDMDFDSITENLTTNILHNITNINNESNIISTYNCDSNRLWPGIGNIKDNPSFIVASPNKPISFLIKTVKSGYEINSPCLLTGDALGTENIGSYQGDPIPGISYRNYELNILPDDFKITKKLLGHAIEIDLDGRTYPQVIKLRRPVILGYRELSLVDSEDAGVLDSMSSHQLYNLSDPFGKIYNEIIIKIFEDIANGQGAGNITGFDIDNKIITVSDIYDHDEFIDYNIWLIWLEKASANLVGDILSGFVGMTIDEHVGRWIYINKNIYHIISNTETTITVANFYNNLDDGIYDVFIFTSFQISRQIDNDIYIFDPKNILNSIPDKYMINGIDVVTVIPEMMYNILGYNPDKDLIKWNRVWNYITTTEK